MAWRSPPAFSWSVANHNSGWDDIAKGMKVKLGRDIAALQQAQRQLNQNATLLAILIQPSRTIPGTSIMRKLTIVAVASILTAAPAFADNPPAATVTTTHPTKPA